MSGTATPAPASTSTTAAPDLKAQAADALQAAIDAEIALKVETAMQAYSANLTAQLPAMIQGGVSAALKAVQPVSATQAPVTTTASGTMQTETENQLPVATQYALDDEVMIFQGATKTAARIAVGILQAGEVAASIAATEADLKSRF